MPDHNPFAVEARKPLTPKQKLQMFLRHGGVWKIWLRWTVWARIQRHTIDRARRALGYRYTYDYDAKRYHWQRPKPRPESGRAAR